ncbi:pseudouridine synthase [Jimgerdemannia flammicorona]|uniref:Pseudouridine synthase n=1 Tax=Jimgerdemannia flammicorona TaxID=994334 RepID=A0A433QQY9_9FUNG|nr:pseudouridine synthase [Jimgerdemannia flammicorona]
MEDTPTEPPAKKQRINVPDPESATIAPSTSETPVPFAPQPAGETQLREADVGITEFVDTSLPGCFTDFMVSEVDMDGNIIHLRDTNPPKAPATEALEEEVKQPVSEDVIYTEMTELLGSECVELVKKMANSGGADVSSVTAPVESDKQKRTAIHQFFKKYFPGRVTTETHEGAIRIRMFMMKDARDKRNRRPDAFEALGGLYCEFCLFKENRDTMEVINLISNCIKWGVKPYAFGYAGTKDRRAITTQRVTVFKVKAERIISPAYTSSSLTTRPSRPSSNVTAPSNAVIDASLTSLRERGFINYFGMQRFGTSTVSTHAVGRALLKGEWEEAVELILMPREGEREEFQTARLHWQQHRDPAAALKLFPRRCVAESQILRHFVKAGGTRDFAGALAGSYVWNHVASERIRLYGCETPVVGDIVMLGGEADEGVEGEEEVTEVDAEDDARTKGKGKGKESEDTRKPLTFEIIAVQKPTQIPATVKVLASVEDLVTYTIHDVILPQPGFDVVYPTNAIGEKYKEIMGRDGLDPGKMRGNVKFPALMSGFSFVSPPPSGLTTQDPAPLQRPARCPRADGFGSDRGEARTSERA